MIGKNVILNFCHVYPSYSFILSLNFVKNQSEKPRLGLGDRDQSPERHEVEAVPTRTEEEGSKAVLNQDPDTTTSPTATSTLEPVTFASPSTTTATKEPSRFSKEPGHLNIWPEVPLPLLRSRRKNVTIYAATKWYTEEFTNPDFIHLQCPKDIQAWCQISTSLEDLKTADAVIFNNVDFNQSLYPKNRNLSQVYLVFSMESPIHDIMNYLPDQINWTMNYRQDADIYHPYFVMENRLNQEEKIDYEGIWSMKNVSLTAAWVVANCNTANKRREVVERAIKEGLQVDIFGSCGKPMENCGRHAKNRQECPTEIVKRYKFYFAFENSNCPGYVTEKFYNAVARFSAIPIVLQRKIYEDIGIPPSSFIAVDDFKSIQELVQFIQNLADDKQRYLEFHKWRESFVPVYFSRHTKFCELCEKLRIGGFPRQSYRNLSSWYTKDVCDNTASYRFLK